MTGQLGPCRLHSVPKVSSVPSSAPSSGACSRDLSENAFTGILPATLTSLSQLNLL